ncbi:MAG: tetratricopeptide repeat-containing sensor histidine kinase [Lutibacter sp.]|nr:tetratricopeptide repeat-containing sensor histidine kinase [Lutibacter sp.]MDP3944521.1 tetratricopeptide repeat-containing sensor histidine kinase [Lutibacter sp.]
MKNRFIILFYLGFSSLIIGQEVADINKLKKELQQELVDTAKVTLHIKISNLYLKTKPDSSLVNLTKALELAKKSAHQPKIAQVYKSIGRHYEKIVDYTNAIKNYNDAFLIFEKLGDKKKMAEIYNSLGTNYSELYAEDRAIEYYLKSLALHKEVQDQKGIASNYTNIGNLYYNEENYDLAEKYFRDALLIYEKLDDKYGISSSYTNIANALADNGRVEEGLNYYKKSIAIEDKLGDQYGIAINYNNIGDCYINLKQYIKAKEYLDKAMKIADSLDEKDLQSIVLLNIADVENKQKRFQRAIYAARESYAIADLIGNLDYKTENLLQASIAYEGLGDNVLALKRLREYIVIKDSLLKMDRVKKIKLFNTLNELEKSQYTISDLSKTSEEAQLNYERERKYTHFLIIAMVIFAFLFILLIQQNASKKKAYNLLEYKNYQVHKMKDEIDGQSNKLKQLNSTKDKFFSIIAHDLKNPFNSIAGFTDLMIENNEIYDAAKRLKFLKIIKGSTAKVSSLLDNLLMWANSQSGNLKFKAKNINLAHQVAGVISFLEIQAINKEIAILNSVEKNVHVKADEHMLDTILRNLISNAIKFTQPKGEIHIYSVLKKDFVEITVKDNGVGMTADEIAAIFSVNEINSSLGTFNEQGSGLGLILCSDFVESHGGKIWVESVVNQGSEFKFTLPIWKD